MKSHGSSVECPRCETGQGAHCEKWRWCVEKVGLPETEQISRTKPPRRHQHRHRYTRHPRAMSLWTRSGGVTRPRESESQIDDEGAAVENLLRNFFKHMKNLAGCANNVQTKERYDSICGRQVEGHAHQLRFTHKTLASDWAAPWRDTKCIGPKAKEAVVWTRIWEEIGKRHVVKASSST